MSVKIHGKDYITVAERLQLAHEACDYISINTELISTDPVTVKATVTLKRKGSDHEETYSDYSAANPNKLIEKQSPIETASTSAVGRALGYAGFGVIDGIATADEIKKAEAPYEAPPPPVQDDLDRELNPKYVCNQCGAEAIKKEGVKKNGQPWSGYFCTAIKQHVEWF